MTGTQTVTVTVTNEAGAEQTDSLTIDIRGEDQPIEDIGVTGVTLEGPTTGEVGTPYSFVVTVTPPDATQPISYTWRTDDQTDISNTGGLTDTVTYTWNMSGTKTVRVRAANTAGQATATQEITISGDTPGPGPGEDAERVYLPILVR
jgi:hypothetical protein